MMRSHRGANLGTGCWAANIMSGVVKKTYTTCLSFFPFLFGPRRVPSLLLTKSHTTWTNEKAVYVVTSKKIASNLSYFLNASADMLYLFSRDFSVSSIFSLLISKSNGMLGLKLGCRAMSSFKVMTCL